MVSKNLMGRRCMPLNILSRSFSSVPCVIITISWPKAKPVTTEATYSAMRI